MKCPTCKGIGKRSGQSHVDNKTRDPHRFGCIQWWDHLNRDRCHVSAWATKMHCTEACKLKGKRTRK